MNEYMPPSQPGRAPSRIIEWAGPAPGTRRRGDARSGWCASSRRRRARSAGARSPRSVELAKGCGHHRFKVTEVRGSGADLRGDDDLLLGHDRLRVVLDVGCLGAHLREWGGTLTCLRHSGGEYGLAVVVGSLRAVSGVLGNARTARWRRARRELSSICAWPHSRSDASEAARLCARRASTGDGPQPARRRPPADLEVIAIKDQIDLRDHLLTRLHRRGALPLELLPAALNAARRPSRVRNCSGNSSPRASP